MGALTYKLSLPFPDDQTPADRMRFFKEMEQRMAAAPAGRPGSTR